MQFYLVFPALFLLMQRHGFGRVALAVGGLSVFMGIGISKVAHYYEPSLLFLKFQYFIAGIPVFHVLSRPMGPRERAGAVAELRSAPAG